MDSPKRINGIGAQLSGDESQPLYAVLIGLREDALLLPNAAMAEVLSMDQVHSTEASLPGKIGNVVWHGYTLPVIDFDQMTGHVDDRPMRRPRIVVLHALDNRLPGRAYAVLCEGQPQLIPVDASSVKPAAFKSNDRSEYVLSRARVSVREVIIPNLEHIESLLVVPTATSA